MRCGGGRGVLATEHPLPLGAGGEGGVARKTEVAYAPRSVRSALEAGDRDGVIIECDLVKAVAWEYSKVDTGDAD